jgi:methionine-rich copper-binding protein CopC
MTPRHARRSIAALAGASLVLLLVPLAVLAHAELDTISPADKSSGPAPQQIVGTFVENVDPSKSSYTVVDASGKVIVSGGVVDPANTKRMTLALPVLTPGAYTIRWTTLSADDNEIARGTTTFTVVSPTPPPPSATPEPSTAASPAASASAAPPSVAPTASPSPSGGTGTPTSTTDVLIPILAVLVLLVLLGLWLLRGRSRRAA